MVKPLPMVTVEGIEYGIVYFDKTVTFESSFDIFKAWTVVVEILVDIVVAIVVAIVVVEFILAQLKLKLKLKYLISTALDENSKGSGNKIETSSISVERILVLSFSLGAKKIQKWQSVQVEVALHHEATFESTHV